MNRFAVLTFLILAFASFPVVAEGAGGIEFRQILGNDFADVPGQVTTMGGYGYGVDDGSMIGGWGMAVVSRSVMQSGGTGYAGGYGGVLQGWQHRWGFLVGNATVRIGFGGIDQNAGPSDNGASAGFSMLGLAEAHLGVLVFPWFEVGVTAGGVGTMSFTGTHAFEIGYGPTVGVRVGWGAY
ncbi:MAG TPA: hypothetical protein VMB23_01300 [Spirochaetia bacterium]|jgi:hypothetical protein|nr:hypothetical protein [Spirochaetia bacterium]